MDDELDAAQARARAAKHGDADNVPERERAARSLNTLVRSLDKVNDMKRKVTTETDRALSKKVTNADAKLSADEIREEIKRRLDRILAESGEGPADRGNGR